MNFSEYLAKYSFNPTFTDIVEINDVRKQAFEHYYRDKLSSLTDEKRPTESKAIRDWRIKNKRFINHEILDTAISDSSSILGSNGLAISMASESLKNWLKDQKFYYLDSSLSFWDFFLRCIYPISVIDPNGKIIVFPVNPHEKELPPSLIDLTDRADIGLKFITSDKILKFQDNSIFGFEAGEREYTIKGNKQIKKFYYISDLNTWYILEPIDFIKDKDVYSVTVWYNHNSNDTPVVSAIGTLTQNNRQQNYQESVFRACLSYLDEFANAFSDDQVMRTKSSHAILAMPAMACGACNGQGTQFVKNGSSETLETCKSCNGTKVAKMPGIADILVLPSDSYDGKVNNTIPVYIEPPLGSLQHSWTTTFELLNMAGMSIGINPLIKNNESGEAMKMRMAKWETKVNQIYQLLMENIEDVLTLIEALLVPKIENRIQPIVKKENRIQIKSDEYLRLKIDEALPLEKQESALNYYKFKYQNNPVLVRIYEIILRYYPQTLLTNEELTNAVGFGRYTLDDVHKMDMAKNVLTDLAEKYHDTFLDKKMTDIYTEAESILNTLLNGSN